MIHELKTWPGYYQDIFDRKKTFEFRRDDRGFTVGDTLVLREWTNGCPGGYTGRWIEVRVSYLLKDFEGLGEGFVIMGIDHGDADAQRWIKRNKLLEERLENVRKAAG